jgi:cysteine desulfurase
MIPYFSESFGNAHSIHSFGRAAEAAVETARQRLAEAMAADDPSQIIFTSGATEGNNWLLNNYEDCVVGPFEHSSIREPASRLGLRTLCNTEERLQPCSWPASLLSVMSVNNETGSVWDARALKGGAVRVHADLTQALGKIPIGVDGLDYATFSGHKIYGPKGIGALYVREEPLEPLIYGGEQESGNRAGTLNVPAIVGFGTAAALAVDEQEADFRHAVDLRSVFVEELSKISGWQLNGGPETSPFILSVSFYDVEGETLVIETDRQGFAISSGAACSSRETGPSPILLEMGVSEEIARGTVRISFGRANTTDSTARLARSLLQSTEKLRTMT